jgi:DNA-binding NtrC family response regulator
MDKGRVRILVVDDEAALCLGIQETLRREGYQVEGATDPAAALRMIETTLYNLVVSDIKMPQVTGLELLVHVKKRAPDTVVILMTAYGTVENAVRAMKDGAYDYLTKPLDAQRLRALVQKALEFQLLVAENHDLRARLRTVGEPSLLVGDSEAIQGVRQAIEEIAPSDVTVLIEGESGTGKELVARSIHLKSARHNRPFVSVNCAALPDQLLESELFGHVKGAFTGAVSARSGRFHQAGHGTLFLDEIGDLSPKGQGDLLRVVEEGTFQKVGGSESERCHARLIAATNRNLEERVRAGQFREDLYYRLSVFPIRVPPLRERLEDIPLLIASFMDHFAVRHQRRRKRLDPETLRICQRFPWPGNVRQLRNVIERLVVTGGGPVADPDSLPEFLRAHDHRAQTFAIRPGMTLAELEKLLIRQTLTHVTSNRAEAAKVLGISRRTLQYKLKEYGLLPADKPKMSAGPSTHSCAKGPFANHE